MKAETGMIGTLSFFSNNSTLMLICFLLASSIIFRHTKTGMPVSITCNTKNKFLSNFVASQTTTTASASEKQIASSATLSSPETGRREYVPGISSICIFSFPNALRAWKRLRERCGETSPKSSPPPLRQRRWHSRPAYS